MEVRGLSIIEWDQSFTKYMGEDSSAINGVPSEVSGPSLMLHLSTISGSSIIFSFPGSNTEREPEAERMKRSVRGGLG